MMDIGKDLQDAYNEGYEQGRSDALSWIPVTERLPERNGVYLTTLKTGDKFYVVFTIFQSGVWDTTTRVTAWMEKPEPYIDERSQP